jgi:hypothetical protein
METPFIITCVQSVSKTMHKQRKRKVIILSDCGSELGIGK